jgi:hypothetical protein
VGVRRFAGRKTYVLATAAFSLLLVWVAAMAVKRSAFDRSRLDALIAQGIEREARVSNPRITPGRGGGPRIDLQWTSPAGVACVSRDHPVSEEFFQEISKEVRAVIVDPDDAGCRAVLVDDVAFERRNAGAMPFLAASVILGVGTVLSGLAAFGARRGQPKQYHPTENA